jgi:hypothetical protein
MPVHVRKIDGYRVSTPGGVKAKSTSMKNAMAQRRLLNAVEHGFKPTGKSMAMRKHVMKMRAKK